VLVYYLRVFGGKCAPQLQDQPLPRAYTETAWIISMSYWCL